MQGKGTRRPRLVRPWHADAKSTFQVCSGPQGRGHVRQAARSRPPPPNGRPRTRNPGARAPAQPASRAHQRSGNLGCNQSTKPRTLVGTSLGDV